MDSAANDWVYVVELSKKTEAGSVEFSEKGDEGGMQIVLGSGSSPVWK